MSGAADPAKARVEIMALADTSSWGAGLRTILRISRMALETPAQAAVAMRARGVLGCWDPRREK